MNENYSSAFFVCLLQYRQKASNLPGPLNLFLNNSSFVNTYLS